jgi:AhpD family alkylhydroperoxidase
MEEKRVSARLTAVDPASASGEVKRLLELNSLLYGVIPNMVRTMALSPPVLRGFTGLLTSLTEGKLTARLREQIALAVADANRSQYCVSMHTTLGAAAGLSEADLTNARLAIGSDSRSVAALRFVRAVVDGRGELTDDEFAVLQRAGFDHEEIVEILGNIVASSFTNYFNKAARVEIDFPIAGIPIASPSRRVKPSGSHHDDR